MNSIDPALYLPHMSLSLMCSISLYIHAVHVEKFSHIFILQGTTSFKVYWSLKFSKFLEVMMEHAC